MAHMSQIKPKPSKKATDCHVWTSPSILWHCQAFGHACWWLYTTYSCNCPPNRPETARPDLGPAATNQGPAGPFQPTSRGTANASYSLLLSGACPQHPSDWPPAISTQ